MANSMQLNLPPTEVHSLDRPRSMPVQSVDRSQDWAEIPGIALAKSGVSRKAAAADMEIDPSLLSAQLAGTKHLSWLRIGKLGPDFWREMVDLICAFHGISVGVSLQDQEDMRIGRLMREIVQRSAAR
ncbi:MAG TPA: hypothetical protein VK504_18755 [Vicinamibacterales bacterium]|nr:hypothetical protein [Vicinamibacterales bacterium]